VVNTSVVTPELFALLDVKPLAGRIFSPANGKLGAPPVALLSEDLWRGRFGADPKITGRSIHLDKHPFTVIGASLPLFALLFSTPNKKSGAPWFRILSLAPSCLSAERIFYLFLGG
jgi:hypothetical protein